MSFEGTYYDTPLFAEGEVYVPLEHDVGVRLRLSDGAAYPRIVLYLDPYSSLVANRKHCWRWRASEFFEALGVDADRANAIERILLGEAE